MTANRQADEALLIDYLLGHCDEAESRELRKRLDEDAAFCRLHEDLRHTFAALNLAVEHEPPTGLVDAALRRIRSARQTDALLAREQLARRDVIRPTFSLRELGAIAGVVLLLLSIFGVSYREAERRRNQIQCRAQLARVGSAMLTYANQNDGYLPGAGGTNQRWLPTASQPAVSNSTGPFKLVQAGYVDAPAFQCPAVGGESFVVQAQMGDFPDARAIHYSYQHSLGKWGLWLEAPQIAGAKASVVILADANPLFKNGRFRRERVRWPVSDNHDGEGQNVLFLAGNSEFQARPSVGSRGDIIYLAEGVYDYDGDEAPASMIDVFLLPTHSRGPDGYGPPPGESPGGN